MKSGILMLLFDCSSTNNQPYSLDPVCDWKYDIILKVPRAVEKELARQQ